MTVIVRSEPKQFHRLSMDDGAPPHFLVAATTPVPIEYTNSSECPVNLPNSLILLHFVAGSRRALEKPVTSSSLFHSPHYGG